MHDLITFLTLSACLAICMRLITYRRSADTRHRPGVGACAWVLIASTGGHALHILLLGAHYQPSIWHLGVLLVLAFLSFRANGNVARILRVD